MACCMVLLGTAVNRAFAAGACPGNQTPVLICTVWEVVDCDGASETSETCAICSSWNVICLPSG